VLDTSTSSGAAGAVNLKAARALGVRVPKAVLSRADQIID